MKRTLIYGLFVLALAGAFFIAPWVRNDLSVDKVDSQWTVKELAGYLDLKPGAIKNRISNDFDIKGEIYGSTRLSELGLSQKEIQRFVRRVEGESSPWLFILKIAIWVWVLAFALRYILTLRNRKHIHKIRVIVLADVFLIFGFLWGASPNPMESVVQLVKSLAGLQPNYHFALGVFLIFAVLSVIGPKFFCSWGCPLGALQETVFNLPVLKKKRLQAPFLPSMIVRAVLFISFLLGIFVFDGGRSIFRHFNYFKVFTPSDLVSVALYTLPVLFVLSFFMFRPFCHWICPFGFISWFLEKVSLNRIVVDKKTCIDCKLCVKACPTKAMSGILDGKNRLVQADCWSCGKCVSECPESAVILK
jgi:polyferredoxin